MVFIFHPIMSLVLPLAVSCIFFPNLRLSFPDLQWFTQKTSGAALTRAYLVFACGPIVAMNSGGTLNLILNVLFAAAVMALLSWRSRKTFGSANALRVVVLGRRGFVIGCIYLILLYGVTYFYLRPEGLPSPAVQLLDLVFYGLAIVGIWFQPPSPPASPDTVSVSAHDRRLVGKVVALVLGVGVALSFFRGSPALFPPVFASFVVWTPLGFLLFAIALANPLLMRRKRSAAARTSNSA